MGEFNYKAKDSRGKVREGIIKAPTRDAARNQLKRMRLKSIRIDAKYAPGENPKRSSFFYRDKKGNIQIRLGEPKISTKDLVIFSRQFATMINSGVPLIQAIGVLAAQQRVHAFGEILDQVKVMVENGATLSQAFQKFPKVFDNLYVAMVRSGEVSGKLDTILLKLVGYIEKAEKIKSQVKSASYYPAIVVVVAISVIAALLVFVVPTFAKQYAEAGKPLPQLTQLVVDLSKTLSDDWLYILGTIAFTIVTIKQYIKTEKGRFNWDKMMLNLPLIGDLLRKIAVGRFCSTMASMLTSGVNLLEALTICSASSGNKQLENFILGIRTKIEQGSKLSEPLSEGGIFPPLVVSMVAVGESTGALDQMLEKVSVFYDEEVDVAIKGLLSMIEPILIVFIGGSVGFIMIAMYLPIFDMASVVGG